MMRLKIAFIGFLILSLGMGSSGVFEHRALVPLAHAAVDVNASELRASADLIAPKQDLLPVLPGYEPFSWQEVVDIPKGLAIGYQAAFLKQDELQNASARSPWIDAEFPKLQVAVTSYSSQEVAESMFENFVQTIQETPELTLLQKTPRQMFYSIEYSSQRLDLLKSLDTENRSLHLFEQAGNLIFQVSLYRESGVFDAENVQAYEDAVQDETIVYTLLSAALEDVQTRVNTLFPPSQFVFQAADSSASMDLSETRELPHHGHLSLRVYVQNLQTEAGTILDSSGLSEAIPGDLYLYLTKMGGLRAGIYAPHYDAPCEQNKGWYRLSSSSPFVENEWNTIDLSYGVEGFSLSLNGTLEASCAVAQERSSRPLFLGDFPDDELFESFIGYVNEVHDRFSLSDSGKTWDSILKERLFLDLPHSDPDLRIFELLKTRGVLVGYKGILNPERLVNRAEAVKMLARALKWHTSDAWQVDFPDVPLDAWYGRYLDVAVFKGIVHGREDGTFDPSAWVTGAELQLMLDRAGKTVDVLDFISSEEGGLEARLQEPLSRRNVARILYTLLR